MNDYKPGDRVDIGDGGPMTVIAVVGDRAWVRSEHNEDYVDRLADLDPWEDPDPLPTVPGFYLSALPGDWIFRLDDEGHWTLLNTNSLFPVRDGHLQRHLPFTRLVPGR